MTRNCLVAVLLLASSGPTHAAEIGMPAGETPVDALGTRGKTVDHVAEDAVAILPARGYEEHGSAFVSSRVRGYNGSATRASNQVSDYAVWKPRLTSPQTVTVSFYNVVYPANSTSRAKVDVVHNGRTDSFYIDQSKGREGWITLGTFDFSGTGEEFVRLSHETTGKYLRTDAVRFSCISNDHNQYKEVIIIDNDPPARFESVRFDDLKSHWAEADITAMANRQVIKGLDTCHFAPDKEIARAEFIAILTGIARLSTTGECSFADCQDESAKQCIGAAERAGILRGLPRSGNLFLPNQSLTRQDMALFLGNLAVQLQKPVIHPPPKAVSGFGDHSEIDVHARNAVEFCLSNSVVRGYPDGNFKPKARATRAEATVALRRFMVHVLHAGPVDTSSQWELSFSDEFDGDRVDASKWEVLDGMNNWTAILSSRYARNLAVRDGCLYIYARRDFPDEKNEWSAGGLTAKFSQQYGFFEARYKYAGATGLNNAFWLRTAQYSHEPGGHEIDVNEGHYPNKVGMNYHFYDHGKKADSGMRIELEHSFANDHHIFAVDWTEDWIIYYTDGIERRRIRNDGRSLDAAIPRLSTAVLPYAGPATAALDGRAMVVDYVRIYRRAK